MYLVLQARTDQSGWHELKCIYEATGLNYQDMAVVNYGASYVQQEHIYEYAKRAKGIIIGGLGESGYEETDPVKKESIRRMRSKIVPVLKELAESSDTKLLGICFGHQLLAEALGSDVEDAPDQAEVGAKSINLSPEGIVDPLFEGLPKKLNVIQAHKAAVMSLPYNSTLLASSSACNIQAFKYKDSMYGVQFHPELNNTELEYRLELYQQYTDKYVPSDSENLPKADVTKILKNFMEITHSNSKIIRKPANNSIAIK